MWLALVLYFLIFGLTDKKYLSRIEFNTNESIFAEGELTSKNSFNIRMFNLTVAEDLLELVCHKDKCPDFRISFLPIKTEVIILKITRRSHKKMSTVS